MAAEQHVDVSETDENLTKKLKHSPSVLENFTKLQHGVEKVRIRGGIDLLRHLTAESNQNEKSQSELKYALSRLIRGLGASKLQTRTGFFAAFVALLNLKHVSVEEIFEFVGKELQKSGSNSKSENADVSSGQILAAGAVIRSLLYDLSNEADKTRVLELLMKAANERIYLKLAACTFIVDLYNKIDGAEFQKVVFPVIKSELSKPWQEHNLDSLYLLIETQNHFPEQIKAKFLKNHIGTPEILCSDSLPQLCELLTTIPRVAALKHPIFDIMIKQILESNLIVEFFTELDTHIQRSNRNKYLVATKLLSGVLEKLTDPGKIPDLLTKNYLQQMINTFKTAVGKFKDRNFQEATHKLFENLFEQLKKDDVKSKIKIKVLKCLLFYPGTFIFEKISKSKLIQNITLTLNSEGVKKLAEIYREVILAEKERVIDENRTEKWWNSDRIYAAHLLVKLLSHTGVTGDNPWKIEQLKFLMHLGLINQEIGHELADSLKETFYSALGLKLTKLEDLRAILSEVVRDLNEIISEDATKLRQPMSEADQDIWQQTLDLSAKIEAKTPIKKKKVVFHTLFLHLGLQLFNNPKLASESLQELFSCYERVKNSKSKDDDSDGPLWIEVVIDLFLNLLSHNSHLLRTIIGCVFPHLCKYMTATAIHQILSVLDPKNQDNPLSRAHEDSSDDEAVSEEEEEEEESEDESDDGDDEENDTVNDKLRLALQQALSNGNAMDSDAESLDLDQLDDEEGEKLDTALGEAFKQFKPNLGRNKKQNKDDAVLTHFRIRVLDLIEVYLNSNPSMLLVLEIMLPLLQILEFTIRDDYQKPLQDRVRACLKKLAVLKKFGDFNGVDDGMLVDLLKSLLDKGTKNAIIVQDMGEKIAECCIFVVNCWQLIQNQSDETPKKKKKTKKRVNGIVVVLKDGLDLFFNRRDCLIPYVLFKNVLQLNWDGILELVPVLFKFIFTDSVRPFRRNQALELLGIFYSNVRFLNSHRDELTEIYDEEKQFLGDCLNFFREFSSNPNERRVREKFLCNLFALLCGMKTNSGVDFDWDVLAAAVRECRSHLTLSKDTKGAFNKLCKSLNVSHIVDMKTPTVKLNVVDEDETTTGTKDKKRKKRNLSKDALKLKKESKKLRLQSLSEGFSGTKKRKMAMENGTPSKKIKAV